MSDYITLENVRLSFVHILKPYAKDPAQEPKYSCTILINKNDASNLAKIKTAIAAATEEGKAKKWNGVVPPIVPNPIHDGDGVKQDGTEYGPECKGCFVFTAGSQADRPVDVVDRNVQKILDATQVYSGMYANVAVNFYPYTFQAKKGIGCGLGPVQKTADGEPLSATAPSAKGIFTAVAPAPGTQAINPVTGQPM